MTVEPGGLVTWTVDPDKIGETVDVVISVSEVNNPTHAATQDYSILVHADPANNAPMITSDPEEDFTIPQG